MVERDENILNVDVVWLERKLYDERLFRMLFNKILVLLFMFKVKCFFNGRFFNFDYVYFIMVFVKLRILYLRGRFGICECLFV